MKIMSLCPPMFQFHVDQRRCEMESIAGLFTQFMLNFRVESLSRLQFISSSYPHLFFFLSFLSFDFFFFLFSLGLWSHLSTVKPGPAPEGIQTWQGRGTVPDPTLLPAGMGTRSRAKGKPHTSPGAERCVPKFAFCVWAPAWPCELRVGP